MSNYPWHPLPCMYQAMGHRSKMRKLSPLELSRSSLGDGVVARPPCQTPEALLLWEPGLGQGQHGEALPEETAQSETDDWQQIAGITLFPKRKMVLKQPPVEGNTSTIRNEFLPKREGLTIFTTVRSQKESQKKKSETDKRDCIFQ